MGFSLVFREGVPAREAGWLVSMATERISDGMSPCTCSSPLGELVGGVDDGLRALEPAGVERVPEVLVERVALGQQLREDDGVLQGHGTALGDGGRAGVRGVADQHDPPAVPRDVEHVGLEPGVVHRDGSVSVSRISSHGPWWPCDSCFMVASCSSGESALRSWASSTM